MSGAPLTLTRPLIFLDLETTGTIPEVSRVVSIGLVILAPDGSTTEKHRFIDPERPIPYEATYGNGTTYEGHGITDGMVAGSPTFAQVAVSLAETLTGVDLGGFNLKTFDLKVLAAEFARAGIAWTHDPPVDGYRLWQLLEARSLADAVRKWLGREPEGHHGALPDAKDALAVVMAQLAAAPDLPRTVPELVATLWARDPRWADEFGRFVWSEFGDLCLNFSKDHKGKPIQQVPRDFLQWVTRQESFPVDTKMIVTRFLVSGQLPCRNPSTPTG